MGGGITKLNSNAFTLIELLAIIVILAIIAVITVPIILNIIENSRKGAATDSAYGYKDSINKYYVSELSNNKKLKLDGTYEVKANGVLNGNFGVTENTEDRTIPIDGEKPSSGKLHYTNTILDGGCLVIGDYKITFKSDGSVDKTEKGNCENYEFSSEQSNGGQTGTPLTIGTNVNYVTSLNNVELDNWKVFLSDENYTYLIYGDYLPNGYVSSTVKSTYKLGTFEYYKLYANDSRTDLISAMITKENWNSLLTGTLNGNSIDYSDLDDDNIVAMGAPTIDLWVNSWNEKYSDDTLLATYSTDVNSNGYDGWYIITSINPNQNYNYGVDLSSKTGYDNTLYFPYQDSISSCDGYHLASPAAWDQDELMYVGSNGIIDHEDFDNGYALRPIISLPTSVVNQ